MNKQQLEEEITAVAMAYMDSMTKIERLEAEVSCRYGDLENAFNMIHDIHQPRSIPELQTYQELEEDRQALHAYAMQILDKMGIKYESRDDSVKVMFDTVDLNDIIADRIILLSANLYREIVNRAYQGLKE